ncbi:hypothetical protein [Aureimonas sp. N4]|uniref:hypothetical protein n=1 Tax=Aureimonas sp. N4 TaxID=1638165 RepID=UPI000B050AC2|nr:hypothetical protein [Aureimonas sp. N4]
MKKSILLSLAMLGFASAPALAQELMLPSGPPRNATEQRLQDQVNAQIQLNRARGLQSSDEVRRQGYRYQAPQPRYERRERAERRWEREDRRRWERQERRRDRDRYWDGW